MKHSAWTQFRAQLQPSTRQWLDTELHGIGYRHTGDRLIEAIETSIAALLDIVRTCDQARHRERYLKEHAFNGYQMLAEMRDALAVGDALEAASAALAGGESVALVREALRLGDHAERGAAVAAGNESTTTDRDAAWRARAAKLYAEGHSQRSAAAAIAAENPTQISAEAVRRVLKKPPIRNG